MITAPAAIDLMTLCLPEAYIATPNVWGGVDVKVKAEYALRPYLDFVRVILDDGTLCIIHLTHNEVNRGEARLQGTMTGMLAGFIRSLLEGLH